MPTVRISLIVLLLCWLLTAGVPGSVVCAQEQSDNTTILENIQKQIEELRLANQKKDKQIEALQKQVAELQKQAKGDTNEPSSLDDWVNSLGTESGTTSTGPRPTVASTTSGARLHLTDISADLLIAAAASTEQNSALQTLQGGAHDPNRRGFTLEQMELSIMGAVDPYFNGEIHMISAINPDGETEYELEEAFATTTSLPYGLQVEAGQSFTEFGRINPQHPHQWEFLDQPVIHSRVFGGDGQRQTGVRIGWLTPLPWFSEVHVSVQNATGETMPSFLGDPPSGSEGAGGNPSNPAQKLLDQEGLASGLAGRPIVKRDVRSLSDLTYLFRWNNTVELNDAWTASLGVSSLFGPNTTGDDGRTNIYGADLLMRWRPPKNDRGWPFVSWESEVIKRDYHADDFFLSGDVDGSTVTLQLDDTVYRDWGLTSQLRWGFKKDWVLGARVDYATGTRDDFGGGALIDRNQNPFRDNRTRLSGLLSWHMTEYSRLRLQYNYDRANHLATDGIGSSDRDAHTVFFGIEISLGAHPAHKY